MKVGSQTYIAKSAIVIGNVIIGNKCSVWENAVIRGDLNKIEIGDGSNVQDCCVIHASPEHAVRIGRGVSIGHAAIVHGAIIEDDCIIGINASVLDGVYIEHGCIIAANAIVPPDTRIPKNSLVAGVPARIIRQDEKMIDVIRKNAEIYMKLAERYLKGEFERKYIKDDIF